jgi:alkanesulfonate monooxygenase SsuD/methylene tetrahydromethanopterin reductase-like flavin-dependent oxidoreductase (luciferase family)
MRFGFMVSSDDPASDDPLRRVADHVERARAARDAGFDTVAVAHRYSYGPAGPEGPTTSRFQPLPLLAHLAAIVGDRMHLATTILLSASAHPVQLAEDVATLDAMCGGRLRLGLGLGWLPAEFEAFGVDRRHRVRRMVELVEVLRRLMTEDEVDYAGRFFTVRKAKLVARPVQRPTPPIWIGASTEAGARRAARIGDTWTISAHSSVDEILPELAAYRAERAALGRPLPDERPISRMVYLAPDRRTAVEEVLPVLAARHRAKAHRFGDDATTQRTDAELARGRWIIGTPEDCVEQIAAIRDALDVNQMIFTMPWNGSGQPERLRTIRLLGSEVIPAFAPSGRVR